MTFALRGVGVRRAGTVRPALSEVTLDIGTGEQVALIGPSGAGKTTLLHVLAGAIQPSEGELSAFGESPWQLPHGARHALRARIFLAPQTPPMPPRQRVVTAVLAGCLPRWGFWKSLASLVRPAAPDAAFDALARFNLQDKLYERVDRLSGGERQRCGMARLLVSDASALLVDEPLSALDPALSRQTLAVLQQEAAARRAVLVCSLHQVELARSQFPRIIGLRDGQVVFDAAREAVTDQMIEALYHHADLTPAPETVNGDLAAQPVRGARC